MSRHDMTGPATHDPSRRPVLTAVRAIRHQSSVVEEYVIIILYSEISIVYVRVDIVTEITANCIQRRKGNRGD